MAPPPDAPDPVAAARQAEAASLVTLAMVAIPARASALSIPAIHPLVAAFPKTAAEQTEQAVSPRAESVAHHSHAAVARRALPTSVLRD